ncbi:MAG: DUF2280 domain-containing protein, partial [Actinobacteria bacterium]|nr:DUF2280 domain-containing protein [Actinomycetota bacterium]
TRLAGFETLRAIAKAMKEDFGIEITPQAIAFYDPTRYSSRPCPKCWSDLFWHMRAEFIERIADIGAAHRTVRLRWLDQMARAQMEKLNTAEARALLKQAADEMKMAGQKDEASGTDYSKLSDAELEARNAANAAKVGLAIVSIESLGRDGGDGAAGEPQPPGEPVSG